MRFSSKLGTVCLAFTVVASTALAQSQSSSASSQQKSSLPLQAGQEQIFFKASDLIGRSAQTPTGQNLGDLSEIVFHPEKGIFGVVKTENDRLAALPWSMVTAVTDKAVVFKTSSQELAGAPTFTEKEWSRLNSPEFTQRIRTHFKQEAMGGSSDQSQSSSSSGASSSDSSTNTTGQAQEGEGGSSALESDPSAGGGASTNAPGVSTNSASSTSQ